MCKRKNKNIRRCFGVVTVEAALVFPILLLLTFGLIEYGWLFLRMETIANAARRGARIAATPDATNGEVHSAISEMLSNAGLEPGSYEIRLTPADVSLPGSGEILRVEVVIPNYRSISLTGSPILPVPRQIEGQMAIAKEGPS